MKFIELTKEYSNGDKVTLNPDNICFFVESKVEGVKHTRIKLINCGALDVKENPETILKLIEEL